MKLSRFYELAVKAGKDADIRPKHKIDKYADSSILYGNPDTQVRRILAGIDMEAAELLLAQGIREKSGLDLVLAHHPEGWAWARLHEVMRLQVDMLARAGLNRTLAREFLDERMSEVERRVLPNNLMRSVDVARLLDMPFACLHTPADNHAQKFVRALLDKEKPKNVRDIVDILMAVPEYKLAAKELSGPQVILGNPARSCGKIFIEMTGGTEGHKDIFDNLYQTGIRTLVSMHLSEEHLKKVKDANLNVVIAGHISSDTLGLNLLLDSIERKSGERFEVINCSGFRRISRN